MKGACLWHMAGLAGMHHSFSTKLCRMDKICVPTTPHLQALSKSIIPYTNYRSWDYFYYYLFVSPHTNIHLNLVCKTLTAPQLAVSTCIIMRNAMKMQYWIDGAKEASYNCDDYAYILQTPKKIKKKYLHENCNVLPNFMIEIKLKNVMKLQLH